MVDSQRDKKKQKSKWSFFSCMTSRKTKLWEEEPGKRAKARPRKNTISRRCNNPETGRRNKGVVACKMASRCSDFLSLEERRSETSIAMKQKIQRLSPQTLLWVRCGGRRSSSSSTRRSARQRLSWWLAGSRTFKRTKTTTIETLCHASIVVREHGSFLRNLRRSKRGFHSESRAVTKLLLGGLLSSSRSSCTRHGTTTKTKKKQMRTRQDFWNCTLLCNLFLIPSLVSSPSRRWNSSSLPSATVAPSCSWMQRFFFSFFFLDLSASGTATCIC